jgi:glutamyl-tRNA synthetase
MKDIDKKIRAYALKNAIAYKGKANPSAVLSSLFNEGLEKSQVKEIMPKINDTIKEISKLNPEEQKKEFDKLESIISHRTVREGLPELPNAEKGVVMRFRPAPSGPLHIGNMIGAGLPTSLYVKKYSGKFYVIVDDTDPERTLKDSYAKIKRDCDWLFGNVTEYLNSSDRMKLYYEYIEKLINKKAAYVCTCSGDDFREISLNKRECPCRGLSVKENTERWENMLKKTKGFGEGDAVLRFKSDMNHPNPAMRDFPLARICLHEHPIQKNKYKVWPLMNLVVAIDDMELKMTHIIRGKDHADNAKRQKMIFDIFGKKFPWTFFIGRVKFADLVLSKRKLTAGIESGEFTGEDDVRLATIAALRKRGYKPEAFKKFVEQRGLTEVDKVMSQKDFFDIIDKFNKI